LFVSLARRPSAGRARDLRASARDGEAAGGGHPPRAAVAPV